MITSPVTEHLSRLAIPYRVIEIPLSEEKKPVRSLEELLKSRGGRKEQVVRSLLFRTESGRFLLLALPSGRKADWGTLRRRLGEKRMVLASPEEVLEVTGYPVGAVPPFPLPEGVLLLVDRSVFEQERVVIGSGVLGYALELSSQDLKRALPEGAEIGEFSKSS